MRVFEMKLERKYKIKSLCVRNENDILNRLKRHWEPGFWYWLFMMVNDIDDDGLQLNKKKW